jgi:phage-related protein
MEIEFWEEPNGDKPVWEFIKASDRVKSLLKKLELYEERTLTDLLKNESAKELKGIKAKYGFSLYEFKPGSNRFLFVVLIAAEKIFLLHAFVKKSDNTPLCEINKALRRAILLNQKNKLR